MNHAWPESLPRERSECFGYLNTPDQKGQSQKSDGTHLCRHSHSAIWISVQLDKHLNTRQILFSGFVGVILATPFSGLAYLIDVKSLI